MALIDVTGVTLDFAKAQRGGSLIDGEIRDSNLWIKKYDGTFIDAGECRGPNGGPGNGIMSNRTITGISGGLASGDGMTMIRCDHSTDGFLFEVTPQSTHHIVKSSIVCIKQEGAGQIGITGGAGVEIPWPEDALIVYTRAQNSVVVLYQLDNDKWTLSGDFVLS